MPVEEWEPEKGGEDEIDLVELARHIWNQRVLIAKITGAFVLLGLLVALLSPVEYETQATLMPEVQNSQGSASNLLQQYGGLLGISGSVDLGQEGVIPPQLYPQIVQSLPFQLELLNRAVYFSEFDTTTTVYTFFDQVYTPSVFSYVLGYTIGLPGKIMSLFRAEELERPLPQGFETDSVISVTKNQMEVIENMRERISVNLNQESGILSLTVKIPDPNAAAEIGQTGIVLIREYVTNYRTRKATEDLAFAEEQMQRARERFEEAQIQLAEFRDSNVNLATARAQTQEQRLQSEYDLAFNVYNTLAQQVEQAKLRVQEQTPVVSIIQPVQFPTDKSNPQRTLIMILSLLLGIMSSAAYIVYRHVADKDGIINSDSQNG